MPTLAASGDLDVCRVVRRRHMPSPHSGTRCPVELWPLQKRRYPSREGKRAATIYVEIAEHRRLRVIAAQKDRSLQDVMVEVLREFLVQLEGMRKLPK